MAAGQSLIMIDTVQAHAEQVHTSLRLEPYDCIWYKFGRGPEDKTPCLFTGKTDSRSSNLVKIKELGGACLPRVIGGALHRVITCR